MIGQTLIICLLVQDSALRRFSEPFSAWKTEFLSLSESQRYQTIDSLTPNWRPPKSWLPFFRDMLREEDNSLKVLACDALRVWQSEASFASSDVQRLLVDASSRVRVEAAITLIWITGEGEPGVSTLVMEAQGRDTAIRRLALERLCVGKLAESAISDVIPCLTDTDHGVRLQAAQTLAFYASIAEVRDALYVCIKRGEDSVSLPASRGLLSIGLANGDVLSVIEKNCGSSDLALRLQALELVGLLMPPFPAQIAGRLEILTKDPDATTRARAVAELGRAAHYGDEAATNAIIQALCDPSSQVRANAAYEAGVHSASLEANTVTPLIGKLLLDHDADVREYALGALECFGEAATPALPALIDAGLTATSAEARVRSAALIARFGVRGVPALSALTRMSESDSDPSVRVWASYAVAQIQPSELATAQLIKALKAGALGEMSEEWLAGVSVRAAVPVVSSLLESDDEQLRGNVLCILAKMIDSVSSELIEAALQLTKNKSPYIRARAAYFLSRVAMPSEAAVDTVVALLMDENIEVATTALRAINRWPVRTSNVAGGVSRYLSRALPDTDVLSLVKLMAQCEVLPDAAIAYLTTQLSSATLETRMWLTYVLGTVFERADDSVPEIGKGLDSASPELRRESARALGNIATLKCESLLEKALHDTDPQVRVWATYGLGQLAVRLGRPTIALLSILNDDSIDVRREAVTSLGRSSCLEPSILDVLIRISQADSDIEMRRRALISLVPFMKRSPKAEQTIRKASESDPNESVRKAAMDLLQARNESGSCSGK